MKKNIIYAILSSGLLLACCTDMNDVSKEFLTPEIRYAGAPDTLKVLGGRDRIVLNFSLSDKSVNRIDVFWNNRTDTLILDENDFVMDVTPKEFFIEIPGLREGAYSFEVITHDVNGNKSIVTRAAGKAYGDFYQNSLLSTSMRAFVDVNELEITWGLPDASALGMEVYYTNAAGKDTVHFFEIPKIVTKFEKKGYINSYQSGTNIKYRTCYLPEPAAVDTFFTPLVETKLPVIVNYSRDLWTIVSGTEPGEHTPDKMLDGDVSTYWQASALSKEIEIDMGETVEINGFYVQKGPGLGIPNLIRMQISETRTYPSRIQVGMNEVEKGKQRFDKDTGQFAGGTVRGRYLRFMVLSKFNTTPEIPQVAELGVYYIPPTE